MSRCVPCPCGHMSPTRKPVSVDECCGRFIDDFASTPAPDAPTLMRSRYTAFVLERAAYLLATWHASRRPPSLEFESGVQWLGLQIKDQVQLGPDRAEVEFVVRQRAANRPATRLHERSRFVREDGRWYYVDGDLH